MLEPSSKHENMEKRESFLFKMFTSREWLHFEIITCTPPWALHRRIKMIMFSPGDDDIEISGDDGDVEGI